MIMSKLEQLINELCPNGVEWSKLGNCCNFQRGTTITAKEAVNGDVPVIAGGLKPAYYHNVPNRKGDVISVAGSGAYAGYVSFWNIPVFISDAFTVNPGANLIPKYVFYFLKNIQQKIFATKKGSGVPHVHGSSISKFEIPIPPLPVQEEIVRILDAFTDYTAELQGKLQAELQVRREQYDYYRNKLLSFEGDRSVEWKTIKDICDKICSGGTPSTSNKNYYSGNIPWLRTQEVDWKDVYDTSLKISEEAVSNSSAKIIPANCVIVAMYGATAAKSCINRIPLATNQACCNLQINKHIADYKYVYHFVCKEYESLKSLGEGSQSNLNAKKIKDYAIPIPPLSEQRRIVAILDKFEALVNDLTERLPAEIAARQEQYEYYRDMLLNFPKAV